MSGAKMAREITSGGTCDPSTSFLCPGMQMAIDGNGDRGLGFHWTNLINLKTGDVTVRLGYRLPKAGRGAPRTLMVNRCPWCGRRVDEPFVSPTEESAAPAPITPEDR